MSNTYQSLFTFFDSDHLQEAVNDANFIHRQVAPGAFQATLSRTILADIVIDTGTYNIKLMAEGCFSGKTVTLIIVHNMLGVGRSSGEEVQIGDLMILAPGEMADFTLPNSTTWSSISVPIQVMEEYQVTINESNIYHLDKQIFSKFIWHYTQMLTLINNDRYPPILLQDMIISLFLHTTEEANGQNAYAYKDSYLEALNIRDEILDNIEKDLHMKELCKLIGKGVRSVERIFKKHFDLSPREYHTYHRFLLIRQMLLHDKNTNVSQAAMKYGYIHFGHFSKKYKSLFGELPSYTLHQR